MRATDYSVLIIWSKEDEAFLAQVLELPGCVADGATREEALTNATIAAQNWIDTAKEIGREIPEPVPFEWFERSVNSEAQLQKAVEIELAKIIPELVKRLETSILHQAFRGAIYPMGRGTLGY
jgi:predicted RNase H-like HicB family nuclease